MLGSKGMYYRLDIDVVLSFCLTEIKAGIAWFENVSAQASRLSFYLLLSLDAGF
jgi:hypothetical protein